MDSYYGQVYRLADGRMEMVYDGFYGAENNSNVQFASEGNPIYRYTWERLCQSGITVCFEL